jgi:hypothetical protein
MADHSEYPGIPEWDDEIYKAVSDRVVVTSTSLGSVGELTPYSRLHLYVLIDDKYEKMGRKLCFFEGCDFGKWVREAIKKRMKTREEAIGRLKREMEQQTTELASLAKALEELG